MSAAAFPWHEALERRALLSITWVNRGNDDFSVVYGSAASVAERVVDDVIHYWGQIAPGADLTVSLYAYRPDASFPAPQDQARNELNQALAALPTALGETLVTQRHPNGDPASAVIALRDSPKYGWYFDPDPAADTEFDPAYATRPITEFYAQGTFTGFDFFSTAMHEMGHALGFQDVGTGIPLSPANPTDRPHTSRPHDLMTPQQPPGERRLISDFDALMMGLAHDDYHVVTPSTVRTLASAPPAASQGTLADRVRLTIPFVSGVYAYQIYRSTSPGGVGVPLGRSPGLDEGGLSPQPATADRDGTPATPTVFDDDRGTVADPNDTPLPGEHYWYTIVPGYKVGTLPDGGDDVSFVSAGPTPGPGVSVVEGWTTPLAADLSASRGMFSDRVRVSIPHLVTPGGRPVDFYRDYRRSGPEAADEEVDSADHPAPGSDGPLPDHWDDLTATPGIHYLYSLRPAFVRGGNPGDTYLGDPIGPTDGYAAALVPSTPGSGGAPESAGDAPRGLVPAIVGRFPKQVIAAQAGGGGSAPLDVTVTNTAAAAFAGPVTVQLYASADAALGEEDALIASQARRLRLSPGRSKGFRLDAGRAVAALPAGTYYLLAQVSETGVRGTAALLTQPTTIAPPFVRLAATFVPQAASTGATLRAGGSGSVVLDVSNGGNVTAARPVTVGLSASVSGTPLPDDPEIIAVPMKVRISPGATRRVRLRFRVPALNPGSYFIVVRLSYGLGSVDPDAAADTAVSPGPFTVV